MGTSPSQIESLPFYTGDCTHPLEMVPMNFRLDHAWIPQKPSGFPLESFVVLEFFHPQLRDSCARLKTQTHFNKLTPRETMYDMFTYIYHKFEPNVVKYTIHGSYGV